METVYTYEKDFMEKFPNSSICKSNEFRSVCRDTVYGTNDCCIFTSCKECWKQEMENGEADESKE